MTWTPSDKPAGGIANTTPQEDSHPDEHNAAAVFADEVELELGRVGDLVDDLTTDDGSMPNLLDAVGGSPISGVYLPAFDWSVMSGAGTGNELNTVGGNLLLYAPAFTMRRNRATVALVGSGRIIGRGTGSATHRFWYGLNGGPVAGYASANTEDFQNGIGKGITCVGLLDISGSPGDVVYIGWHVYGAPPAADLMRENTRVLVQAAV